LRARGISYIDTVDPRRTLLAFDDYLAEQNHAGDLIVIGGTALALLGVISRPTRECDVLEPPLDPVLRQYAREFAELQRTQGNPLDDEWLNDGHAALAAVLPSGWRLRLTVVLTGKALRVRVLGRSDLLASKVWALCDRATDLTDCMALAPRASELAALRPWLHAQDLNPDWPQHVDAVLSDLARRCDHGI
jgi:Nucleotidyltransferase of unknown function (DUF6036)